MINHMFPCLIFGLLSHESAETEELTNAETYLDLRQISTMEFFGLIIFAKNIHHRFSIRF